MKAVKVLHQKATLEHQDGKRTAIFEIVIWKVPITKDYPEGVKFRAWFSEKGETIFGIDNHKPKGPHFHIYGLEIGYIFRGSQEMLKDIRAMIEKEGFIYEE